MFPRKTLPDAFLLALENFTVKKKKTFSSEVLHLEFGM